jgi:hypothetical protein
MSEGAEQSTHARWRRTGGLLAFAVGVVLLLHHYAAKPPVMNGDGWEYVNQIESFHSHGTPELRSDDLLGVDAWSVPQGWGPAPRPGYHSRTAPDGREYSLHFWGYALTAAGARAYLHAVGGNELAAMQLINVVWFALAAFVVLFVWPVPLGKRLVYLGLVCVGPVLWYLSFTGTEVFSWSWTVLALVAYDARKYGWAATAAAVASTQNPTLVFLCGAALLMALWERRWRQAAWACVGTGIAFLPAAFFKYHFGKPSLVADGFVSASYISWARTWGYAFDLNQGLFPYAPFLVIGALIGAVRLALRRSASGLVMIGALVAVAVGTEVQVNWNSSCVGVLRYVVWLIPGVAWVMVEGLGSGRAARAFAVVAVVTGGAMVYIAPFKGGYLVHTPVAKWVLIHCPQLYYPEPEVFVERIRMVETGLPREYPVPTGFVAPNGDVTKLLLDPADVDAVAVKYEVTPEYLVELRTEASSRRRHFYSHPPPGAVRAR